MKAPQKSLKDWGDQKWRTKSGKPSSKTGERYLPEAAIKSLTPAEYAATTKAKREGKSTIIRCPGFTVACPLFGVIVTVSFKSFFNCLNRHLIIDGTGSGI